MEGLKKRSPDYTDIAYREAVSRLKYLLAESYSPQTTPTKIPHMHTTHHHHIKGEDSGDETDASAVMSDRSRHTCYRAPTYAGTKRGLSFTESVPRCHRSTGVYHTHTPAITSTLPPTEVPSVTIQKPQETAQPPPELIQFIERQEEYIEQLEKESQFCREELTSLLRKVKEIISENEGLHEKEKSTLLKSVFECFESPDDDNGDEEETDAEQSKILQSKSQPKKKKRLEGPSIVFESRISELEAQLTQTKIDLRKAQEEADTLKRKFAENIPYSGDISASTFSSSDSAMKQQIETLQREKEELAENLAKMSALVSQVREKEADASHKAKRSLDVVDQAQFEKAQAELEVRRLKDELDRQHEKLREMLQDQGRRIQEERGQIERRYAQQIDQLTADLQTQWDATSKLQLELERQRRVEADLRRELQQKSIAIDELKKELNTKIAGLQSEASQSAAERGSLEQELASSRLSSERAEREYRQESARLQAEIQALRQRLDRSESDLLHSRRENLRMAEQVASLEREVNLAKMMKDSTDKIQNDPGSKQLGSREKELTSMILDMEAKHVQTVGELEAMIQSQNQLMEKLKVECHTLTEKLEESSTRHKKEKMNFRQENADLLNKLEQVWLNCKELQHENSKLNVSKEGQIEQITPLLKGMMQTPEESKDIQTSHVMMVPTSNNKNMSSQVMNPCMKINQTIPPNIPDKNMNNNPKEMSPCPNIAHSHNCINNDLCPEWTQTLTYSMSSLGLDQEQDMNPSIVITNNNQELNPSPELLLKHNITNNQGLGQEQKCHHSPEWLPNPNITINLDQDPEQKSDPSLELLQIVSSTNIEQKPPLKQTHSKLELLQKVNLTNPLPKTFSCHQLNNPLTYNNQIQKQIQNNQNPKQNHNQNLRQNLKRPLNFVQPLNHNPNSKPNHLQREQNNFSSSSCYYSVESDDSFGFCTCASSNHPLLSPVRREVAHIPPLTLEDLASDSDSSDSQSAQLHIFDSGPN